MYNESMMYNMPMQGGVAYCPFMRSMYMMPDMMLRSDDLNNELDMSLPEDIDDNLNDDLRDDDSEGNLEDAREDTINNEVDEYPSDFTLEVDNDNNRFRSPVGPDEILRMIEQNNPMVIRRLVTYGIPYQSAINMIRRTIYLTLQYHR